MCRKLGLLFVNKVTALAIAALPSLLLGKLKLVVIGFIL